MADVTISVEGEDAPIQRIFPNQILPELSRRIASRGLFKTPTEQELQALVEVAYFASLTGEELRLCPFTIAFFSKSDTAIIPVQHGWSPIIFREPRPFSVPELSKLSPAMDFSQTILCVSKGATGELEIWGAIIISRSMHKFRTGLSPGCSFSGPPRLHIRVSGPGNLIFEEGITRLLEYRQGVEIKDPLPVLQEDGPVFRFLQSYKCPDIRPILYPFSLLARRILNLGHGGMVLLVNDLQVEAAKNFLDIKYEQAHEDNYLMELGRWASVAEHWRSESYLCPDKSDWRLRNHEISVALANIQEATDAYANLAMVDGALVLTTSFKLIGFGARIKGDSPPDAYRALNAYGSRVRNIDLRQFGTRHNAAAAFIKQCPDSLVYVCSEDGVASVFMNRADKVVLWRPVDLEVIIHHGPQMSLSCNGKTPIIRLGLA